MNITVFRRASIASLLIALSAASVPAANAPSETAVKVPSAKAAVAVRETIAKYIKRQIDQALAKADETGDFAVAASSLAQTFDQAIAYARDSDIESIRQADFALRMVEQLQTLSPDDRVPTLRFLKANPELAHTLVFLIKPQRQSPQKVYAVLANLREKRAAQLEKFANLTAAICVVHWKPLTLHINENKVTAGDPIAIFDFYAKNESRMFFGIKQVPAELLTWVVDNTATPDEMEWALSKYAGDKKVGARFFDIKYDYDSFLKGTPKKVTVAGFSLRNVLKYGGVCIDQAYFAMTVGKSIGVPTAMATALSAETGHAWVGFLQAAEGKGWWNFRVGRYQEYQGIRGNVQDPQTRERIPDSEVSLLAELIGTRPADRQTAAALTDAAARLAALAKDNGALLGVPLPADVLLSNPRTSPRKTDASESMALVELALHQSDGYSPAWFLIRDLAKDSKLTIADKKHWADLLNRLAGTKYPDFTLSVLAPMIETIEDYKEQNSLWNAAFAMFQKRFDLAAEIRMSQAKVWEAQNNTANAGACYMDVIERYSNAGPFVIDALKHAEKLLKESNRGEKVVTLYEQTWSQIQPPGEMAQQFTTESNWYRVGKMYAAKLKEAGDAAKAQDVLDALKNPSAFKASNKKTSS